jgi:ribosomal-protein-alanine N-acetyltransferase
MRIREIQPGEGARAAELAAGSPTAAPWSAADYEAIVPASAGMSGPGHAPEVCLVAEAPDGRICGLVHARVVAGEAELLNLVVAFGARRRGIATALLSAALDRVKRAGAKAIWLEVRESNREAIAFYQAHAFEQRSRRPNYYRDPTEDALVFSLGL